MMLEIPETDWLSYCVPSVPLFPRFPFYPIPLLSKHMPDRINRPVCKTRGYHISAGGAQLFL